MKARAVLIVALGLAAGLSRGCSSYEDPATGKEATYSVDTLRTRLDLEIGTVYDAAREAARELRLRMVRAAEDGISGEIRAVNAQHDLVDIELGALPQQRTLLAIRIGAFGDRNKSIVLFEQILQNLSEEDRVAAAPRWQWSEPAAPLPAPPYR